MRRTAQDIQQLFTDNGLTDYWHKFADKLKPCFRIRYSPAQDQDIPIGKSKLGGLPDLPRQTEWAKFHHLPLTFLAQINLAELPDDDVRKLLPDKGLLSFFYSLENDDYTSSPHKVLFSDRPINDLERKAAPANLTANEMIYETGHIHSMAIEQSLPGGETEYVLETFKNDDQKRWIYWELAEPDNSIETTNKQFGYPYHSDDRFELICECIATGDKQLDQINSFTEIQKQAIRDKWVLLLQIDSNTDLNMYMGADLDCFYFWITEDDLTRKDFTKTIAFSIH